VLTKECQDLLRERSQVVTDIEKRIRELESETEALKTELGAIALDENLGAEIAKVRTSIEQAKASLDALRREESDLRVLEGSLSQSIKRIAAAGERTVELRAQIAKLDLDISEWQLTEKAMEGIITLEIDDAGPTVSAITNDILFSCYGPRFAVSIKTQTEKANGTEMKEDFDIVVFDSERDERKSLSVMSGGEETWLDDAISRGISLFNASRGGKHYQTLFSDEKDGRLTERKRKEFMAVKRKVLELGGFDAEYFISHTKEIQEMADSVIDLNDFLTARSESNGAEGSRVSGREAEAALF
jgi:exonuclease SbcC